MGLTFEVVFDDGAVKDALDRLMEAGRSTELLNVLGDYGRDSTRRRFLAQEAPDGSAWAPLNPGYSSMKPSGPSGFNILYLTGTLEGSITYRAGVSEVAWGSPVIYAAVHQFGATIRPKNKKALVFKLGLGGVIDVFAQSVTIPARPYLGISAEDAVEIPKLAEEFLLREFGA